MKYIKFTYVSLGQFPAVTGLQFVWARETAYPTDTPEFFGTCPDDADIQVDGVLGEFSRSDWEQMQADEMAARYLQVNAKWQAVSPRQIRQALTAAGLRAQVESAIAGGTQDLKDWWEFATQFERTHPMVVAMGTSLGVSETQLDALFQAAAEL